MPPQTRAQTARSNQSVGEARTTRLSWLFHHEANKHSRVLTLEAQPNTALENLRQGVVQKVLRDYKLELAENDVTFYTPKSPTTTREVKKGWMERHQDVEEIAEQRSFAESVDMIPHINERDHLHLIVVAEETTEAVEQIKENVEEARKTLTPLRSIYNRFNTLRSRKVPAPSSTAKLDDFLDAQTNPETAIYDGFFKSGHQICTLAPPIQIFHPVFNDFLRGISDPSTVPTPKMLASVSNFMTTACSVKSGLPKNKDLYEELSTMLDISLVQETICGRRSANAVHVHDVGTVSIPVLIVENKRAIGEGECDALIQAEYTCVSTWNVKPLRDILDRTCAPTFLIAGGGPYFAILGFVYTDRWIVQRLTDIMWMGTATMFEEAHKYRIATVFTVLSQQVKALCTFYDRCINTPPIERGHPEPHPRFFPCWTTYIKRTDKKQVIFKYIQPLEQDDLCVTWLAEVVDEDRADESRNLGDGDDHSDVKAQREKLVVKFVDRYGYEAHDLLAGLGYAPALHYIGSLTGTEDVRDGKTRDNHGEVKQGFYVGPIRMVVMDFVDGKDAGKLDRDEWPVDAAAQVEEAMNKLRTHEPKLVYGDLRLPNVMFPSESGKKVQIIDFDWAGLAGEAMYPITIELKGRVENVKRLGYITSEHDSETVKALFG